MEEMNPVGERCLTPVERREIKAEWVRLRDAMEPLGKFVEQPDDIDCDELYSTFLRFSEIFDAFERSVMRSKQIRLLHAGHRAGPS